ncbi:MAG: hypothetical protein JWP44_603 [Mucilaginibacter sp.]|nr:hypothetical protein [Mucilaginibacter sp.]
MKNAIVSGALIGVLSGLWMFVMKALGYSPQTSAMAPIEYAAVLIPLVVLFFAINSYRSSDCNGKMGYLEGLLQCFKILLIGGAIAIAAAIIYIDEFGKEANLMEFSGRVFGALLVGVLFALGVPLIFTTNHNKVD